LRIPLIFIFTQAHNTSCGPLSETLDNPGLYSTLLTSPTLPSKSCTCHPRIDVVLSEMMTAQWNKPQNITCPFLINWN